MVLQQSRADVKVLKSLAKNDQEKEAVTNYADDLEAYIAGTPSLAALLLEEVRLAEAQVEGRPSTCEVQAHHDFRAFTEPVTKRERERRRSESREHASCLPVDDGSSSCADNT